LEHYYDVYGIDPTDAYVEFEELFGNSQPTIVEIGFGMGEATVDLAVKFPNYNFFGIEVFQSGVGRLLLETHRRGLKNLKLYRGDAAAFVERNIRDASVCGFHVFFPDPWPKKRHHKRRLLQSSFVKTLSQKLEPGGYLYAVSDWEDYAEQILQVVEGQEALINPYSGYAPPRPWRPRTSFQRKGEAKNHKIYEVWAEKRAL